LKLTIAIDSRSLELAVDAGLAEDDWENFTAAVLVELAAYLRQSGGAARRAAPYLNSKADPAVVES